MTPHGGPIVGQLPELGTQDKSDFQARSSCQHAAFQQPLRREYQRHVSKLSRLTNRLLELKSSIRKARKRAVGLAQHRRERVREMMAKTFRQISQPKGGFIDQAFDVVVTDMKDPDLAVSTGLVRFSAQNGRVASS